MMFHKCHLSTVHLTVLSHVRTPQGRASFPEPFFFLSPKSWQGRRNRRPSFSVHVANEHSVPNEPYSRGCSVLLFLNSVLDLGQHVSLWCFWGMDSEKHWLKQSKTKTWNQRERKKKSSMPCLLPRWKRQLFASCWRCMFYVGWCMTCHSYAALVDDGGTEAPSPRWVFFWCETANYFW